MEDHTFDSKGFEKVWANADATPTNSALQSPHSPPPSTPTPTPPPNTYTTATATTFSTPAYPSLPFMLFSLE